MALIWALLFILLCKSRNCHRHELCSSPASFPAPPPNPTKEYLYTCQKPYLDNKKKK
jgi:hypothetical protein